jgi:bacillopeptidase F
VTFRGIGGSADRLVAVGSGGAIWTSETGNVLEWTRRDDGTLPGLNDVIWTGDRFIAVGDLGTVLQSADGLEWSSVSTRTHFHLRAIHEHNGQVVVMGDYLTILGASTPEALPPVQRISGENRFATAIEISQQGWADNSSPYVLLARSHDFADALAGVPLAHALKAPILLTDSNSLYGSVLNEIQRLGATDVILLGGTAAISDDVAAQLDGYGYNVERLSGNGRYETAAEIARRLKLEIGDLPDAVIATGSDFPDALSAASYAAISGQPILLVHPTVLPGSTQDALTELGIQNVTVGGGTAAISSAVFDALSVPGSKDRVFDTNRYTTAVAMAEHFDLGSNRYFLATGTDFPNAITGAVLAARQGVGLLLVYGPAGVPPAAVQDFFSANHVEEVVLLGGSGAICEAQENWLLDYFSAVRR